MYLVMNVKKDLQLDEKVCLYEIWRGGMSKEISKLTLEFSLNKKSV